MLSQRVRFLQWLPVQIFLRQLHIGHGGLILGDIPQQVIALVEQLHVFSRLGAETGQIGVAHRQADGFALEGTLVPDALPIQPQNARRKYSCRTKDRMLLESVVMPMKRESTP